MKKGSFSLPMKKSEKIFGWIYLPIHIFAGGYIIGFVDILLQRSFSVALDDPWLNLIWYSIGFIFILSLMFRYLKASFFGLCDNVGKSITSVIVGYVFYYALAYVIAFIIYLIIPQSANPNDQAIFDQAKLNVNVMTVVGVILAPIVEEVLFRGVVFGTLRNKNRVLAYVISAIVFSVYHLWSYFLTGFDSSIFLHLLEYIPGAVVLAWCYERSHNLWAPIFLHALINLISLAVQFSI